jgi:hypothetical protein
MNEAGILKHYLAHEIYDSFSPLEQTYAFQGGEIDYRVHIRRVENVENP